MVINSHKLLGLKPIKDMLITKHHGNGISYGLSEAGYDIRIKQQIFFSKEDHGVYVDEIFTPGRFALASSVELFHMPAILVGIVHDKSTWARRSLSVFNTVIEPGWQGHLTLELVYHGDDDLIIPAGTGIAQVIFHEVAVPSFYNGKYQNQENEPVPARES